MIAYANVLLLFVLWTHVHRVLTQSYPIIYPSQSIEVEEGQNLEVRCSIGSTEGPPKALYWRGVWKSEEEIHQQWTDNFTRTLVIRNITGKDAGIYQCFYNSSTVQTKKGLSIRVISKLATGARCHSKEFLCETSKNCISMEKRCNKQEDCIDGSDERNCQYAKCLDMFICQNQQCINKTLVCDSLHINHCGDWSDEYCLITDYQFPKTEVINATTNQPSDETQMSWLKTTVYAVIGCTVGTVLLISVIVIIVFRFRMKSSLRSTERALRRYHMTVNSRSQQDNNQNSIEMDPFLSSSATYGNIIVNVNNGVQYIPRSDFSPIGVPPSYSDVEREMNINRGSPPPTYSTIDRNPPREVINFNNYIIHDSSIASACATCLPSLSRDSSILSESELCVQQARPVNNLCSDQQTRVTSNTCSVSVQTTNDDPEAGDGQRTALSCRCQSLSVQNGEIVLRDSNASMENQESSQSQTPHTDCSSCVRVCQLGVQDGAIVLTSQNLNSDPINGTFEEGQSNENLRQEDNRNDMVLVPPESAPALIQVEGGEIVLRESNPPTVDPTSQQTEGATHQQ
ncbi:uncharacterized protein LOC133186756 [Saccostrea echinata]|uniref:uncharacterized protein LOC133186756 n=1 Tax=Saccostrea echinata TaxID=191078 RepID=UPI002A838D01|nr:uncharacterized protein LOC133186756 [Saccostrea echinata]